MNSAKSLRAECCDEIDAARLPLRAPCGEERLEAGALAGAPLVAVGRQDLDQDVEVPDVAQPGPDVAKLAAIAPPRIALEPVAEDPPRGAHPPRRDAHRVHLLGVLAGDDAGHAREHLRQVEAQDLAPGFRPRIVGPQAGGPAVCEACRRQTLGGGHTSRSGAGTARASPARTAGGRPDVGASIGSDLPVDRAGSRRHHDASRRPRGSLPSERRRDVLQGRSGSTYLRVHLALRQLDVAGLEPARRAPGSAGG